MDKVKYYFKRFQSYWVWVFREYFRKDCMKSSATLTLTSLFAFVPLFLIIVNVLSLFNTFNGVSQKLQNFIFENTLPSSASMIESYINNLFQKMNSLPILSILFLFLVIYFMIKNLELVLNKIFYVRRQRPVIQGFLTYWSLMTLGPILLGVGFIISSYLLSLNVVSSDIGMEKYVLMLISFLFSTLTLLVIYAVLPYTKVNIAHALIVSIIIALVFDASRTIFSYYIITVPTYSIIYGSLSLIPIFILWVYISWQIFLLGAVMLTGISLFKYDEFEHKYEDDLTLVVKILEILAQHQKTKEKGLTTHQICKMIKIPAYSNAKNIIIILYNKNIIQTDNENRHYLCSNLQDISLLELYNYLQVNLILSESSSIYNKKLDSIKLKIKNNLEISVDECLVI